MLLGSLVTAALGEAFDLAKTWFKNKKEEAQIKRDVRLEAMKNQQEWEKIALSKSGWRDDFYTLILTFPVIAIAYAITFDDLQVITRLHEGFNALRALPEWYQGLLYISVLSAFGYKVGDAIMNKLKK